MSARNQKSAVARRCLGIVFSIGVLLLGEIGVSLEAQEGLLPKLPQQRVTDALGRRALEDVEFTTVTCPRDGRMFEIEVDKSEEAFRAGNMRVTCPYDGYEFYTPMPGFKQKAEKGVYDVRCPVDGKIFKAELEIGALLSGEGGQILRCPYDGTEFRLSVNQLTMDELRENFSMTTFRSPTDGRFFKAMVDPLEQMKLFSPFTGEAFESAAENIVRQAGIPQGPRGEEALLGGARAPETRPLELSRIEMMFSEEISLGIPRNIRQFGYDIFPESQKLTSPFLRQEGALGRGSSFSNVFSQLTGSLLGGEMGKQVPQSSFDSLDTFSAGASSVPVASDYVLGPEDTIVVSMWGAMQGTFPVTVDRDGKILLPKVGPVYVWGLTFGEAEELLKKSLTEHYSNVNLSITMGRLRTIRIFVLGEVKRPGAYLLNPQSTAFHALYAAGGPTKLGTLRGIKLLREGHEESTFDLYKLLLKGEKEGDIPLEANDTILVPPIGEVIGIAGSVKRPAIYEVTSSIHLDELVEMAGGPTAIGYLQRIQIERVQDRERKVVLDLEFKGSRELARLGDEVRLWDGDLVLISPISPGRHQYISLAGNVVRPGDYELKGQMRILDLIEKGGGLRKGTYFDRADVSRFQADNMRRIIRVNLGDAIRGEPSQNILLEEWDIVRIYSRSDVVMTPFVEIHGAVRQEGKYELTDQMRLSDLLFRAGGFKPTAALENAELFRLKPGETSLTMIPLDVRGILEGTAAEKDLYLSEGDRLFIHQSHLDRQPATVTLSGEFLYPGEYVIRQGERLSSVIQRAGGFTDQAFLKGTVFTRESLRKEEKERTKLFLESEQLALLQEVASLGAGFDPGQKQSRMDLAQYHERLMEQIKNKEYLGRMIVKLAEPDQLEGTPDDFVLEDGDSLKVPPVPSSVLVVGNVYNPTAVSFAEGKNVEFYLRKAGDLTKGADEKRIYLVKANGEAYSQFIRLKKVERGDTIVVPEAFRYKSARFNFVKETADFFFKVAFGAIAIAAVD